MPSRTETLKELGIESGVTSEAEVARVVEHGLPAASVERLLDLGFSKQEVFRLVIPQRTLTHRKLRRQVLTGDESDKTVRLARVRDLALRVFGRDEKAWGWLRKPAKAFDNRPPVDLLGTEAGARAVEEALYGIDEGMFA
jgi:putative toxin-antitoxin system antitoxin component (TIGR02293 family)